MVCLQLEADLEVNLTALQLAHAHGLLSIVRTSPLPELAPKEPDAKGLPLPKVQGTLPLPREFFLMPEILSPSNDEVVKLAKYVQDNFNIEPVPITKFFSAGGPSGKSSPQAQSIKFGYRKYDEPTDHQIEEKYETLGRQGWCDFKGLAAGLKDRLMLSDAEATTQAAQLFTRYDADKNGLISLDEYNNFRMGEYHDSTYELTQLVIAADVLLRCGCQLVVITLAKKTPQTHSGIKKKFVDYRGFGGCIVVSKRALKMPDLSPELKKLVQYKAAFCELHPDVHGRPNRVLVMELPCIKQQEWQKANKQGTTNSVGAVDGFIGVLAMHLASGQELENCLPRACEFGSLCLRNNGAVTSYEATPGLALGAATAECVSEFEFQDSLKKRKRGLSMYGGVEALAGTHEHSHNSLAR